MTELIFTYGTLQDTEVQQRVIGRIAACTSDALLGYRTIQYRDKYLMAVPDGNGRIEGKVFEATPEELERMDYYETSAYLRVRETLESGRETWVYRNNPIWIHFE